MALNYSTEFINSTGMISVQRFQLHRDGRRVQFETNDDANPFKKIFLLIDGELTEFKNGSRMDTPIGMGGRLFAAPHEAYAVIIDTRAYNVPEVSVPITPVTVMFSHGKQGVIKFSGKLKASIAARDPEKLAQAFVDGLTSPTLAAEPVFKEVFREAIITEIPDLTKSNPMDAINMADSLSLKLRNIIEYTIERKLPWCRVNTCEVMLTVENVDELVEAVNEPYTITLETKRVLLESILRTFGASPLSPEVAKIIEAYATNNPGLSVDDYMRFCKSVKEQFATQGAKELINMVSQFGFLPSHTRNMISGGK